MTIFIIKNLKRSLQFLLKNIKLWINNNKNQWINKKTIQYYKNLKICKLIWVHSKINNFLTMNYKIKKFNCFLQNNNNNNNIFKTLINNNFYNIKIIFKNFLFFIKIKTKKMKLFNEAKKINWKHFKILNKIKKSIIQSNNL